MDWTQLLELAYVLLGSWKLVDILSLLADKIRKNQFKRIEDENKASSSDE